MGFPMTMPVHSRAEDTSAPAAPPPGASAREQLQMGTARRSDVKATAKTSGKESKQGKPALSDQPLAPKKVAKADAKKGSKEKVTAKHAVRVPEKAAEKAPKKALVAEKSVKSPASKVLPEAIAVVSLPQETTKMKSVAAVAAVVAPGVQRSGRPSSRLAQLTVPSMAQSVASTAAKASYSQSIPSTVIVPALSSSIKKDAKLANNWKSKPVAEITDAELLAMSDDDYMNETQLAAFRLKLQALRQTILNSAGETTEHLREDTSVVPDPADRATIEEEHALELRTRDRERKLLKKIEQSIARIDAGDYGYCDETGEPIGVGRLLARPTATLSLEAQQRRELKQKMFGD
jgi:DnaK suppressor protein